MMDRLAFVISSWREQGIECVLVTSGAVAAGRSKLKLPARPQDIAERQAVAAVGQGILLEKYSYFFDKYGLTCAQILLTRSDLGDASHYSAAHGTFAKLFQLGVVPIVNENDTVTFEELCFGDNDRLSALVTGLVAADLLVLLTDVDGLYTANPREDSEATLITFVDDIAEVSEAAGQAAGDLGTGGMQTKLQAADIAARFGAATFMLNGERAEELRDLPQGKLPLGTYFAPAGHRLTGKKRWLVAAALSLGSLTVDQGAAEALCAKGKSLLASGVIAAEGQWERRDVVRILNVEGTEIARGLAELSSSEVVSIMGLRSAAVQERIPELRSGAIVHRDRLVLI
jgi:glutamate 5-kinase